MQISQESTARDVRTQVDSFDIRLSGLVSVMHSVTDELQTFKLQAYPIRFRKRCSETVAEVMNKTQRLPLIRALLTRQQYSLSI